MEYYYTHLGDTLGPFYEVKMSDLLQSRVIDLDTLVWCADMTEWASLKMSPIKHLAFNATTQVVVHSSPTPRAPPPPASWGDGTPVNRQSLNRHSKGLSMRDSRRSVNRYSRPRSSAAASAVIDVFETGSYLWIEDDEIVWELCIVNKHEGSIIYGTKVSDGCDIVVGMHTIK